MQVQVQLDVTAITFFDLLIESVIYDIEQATNKKIKPEEIVSGYTYTKYLTNKVGKKGHSTVELTKVERPSHYEAIFRTSRGVNTVSYTIEEAEGDSINVTYYEEYQAINKSSDTNFKFMRFFYNGRAKKRSMYLLKQMETYILQQSNGTQL